MADQVKSAPIYNENQLLNAIHRDIDIAKVNINPGKLI